MRRIVEEDRPLRELTISEAFWAGLIPCRVYHVLSNRYYNYRIEELAALSDEFFLSIDGLGKKSLRAIREATGQLPKSEKPPRKKMDRPVGIIVGSSSDRLLRQLSHEWQLQPVQTWKDGRGRKHYLSNRRQWCVDNGWIEAELVNIAKAEYPPIMRWRVRLLVDYDSIPKQILKYPSEED